MGEKMWKNIVAVIGIGVGIGIFSLLNHFLNLITIFNSTQPTSAQGVTFAGGFANFLITLGQFRNQRKQIKVHEDQHVDNRFTAAVDLLGNDKTSTPVGAIYALYQLAVDDAKYRSQIAQILCSHVRSHTNEEEYQESHKDRPSDEIQTTINLLVREVNDTRGLYCQGFGEELPRLDFNHAYLVGAKFRESQCKDADFKGAQCQGADFSWAWCQDADFTEAQCQRAYFFRARCQNVDFTGAQCRGAVFSESQCPKADFSGAQCQGVRFVRAQCKKANFREAWCQNADFVEVRCQDASFVLAQCQGAYFFRAQCQKADFTGARCQGANFREAQCQSVDFRDTLCQNADFFKARCQGAYAENLQSLDDRNIPTKLENMIIAGKFLEYDIQCIEDAKEYCSKHWYESMQKIIEANKGKEEKRGEPAGIVKGILEDSKGKIPAIIQKLKAIWKRAT